MKKKTKRDINHILSNQYRLELIIDTYNDFRGNSEDHISKKEFFNIIDWLANASDESIIRIYNNLGWGCKNG